jgi:predicted signal transduction protein with EAL and GGDEF domain
MELKAAQLCNLLKSHCPLPFENGELAITLGMASFPQHGDTGEAVAQAAATAMKKNSA